MQTIEFPSLAEQLMQPAEPLQRERQLRRLVELRAAAEATDALRVAALAEQGDGALAAAVRAAVAIVSGAPSDEGESARATLRNLGGKPELARGLRGAIHELRLAASSTSETGACTIARALELWSWTAAHFERSGESVAPAMDELAELLTTLLAARALALEVAALPAAPASELRRDLSYSYAARVSSETGARCAELVFGYRNHLKWDADGCAICYGSEELDDLEGIMPGIACGAGITPDVLGTDGSHPAKEGPCVRFDGVEGFVRLRSRLDGCLTGARIAKERAAAAIASEISEPQRTGSIR